MTLKLQFDANQPHQTEAVQSTIRLFEGLPRRAAQFALGDEIVANLPRFEALSESWLYDNIVALHREENAKERSNPQQLTLKPELEMEDGYELEGVGNGSWRYPSFTVEMETGTGKTYVYLRTIHELRKNFGFSKFIVVVPSIAIYQGVIKSFKITRDHFAALYGNETVNLVEYDGSRLSQLRSFATSTFVEILVITLDSFNKATNVIFKPSEQLPGERLPFQFIQETRPILILDEPQNMESDKAREALRTLHPLLSLRYSATHRTTPNLVYRLTPFDAYQQNLVKKIQVFGVTERENVNRKFLGLEEIKITGGLRARVRTYVDDGGVTKEAELWLKDKEDLFKKTKRPEHKDGYTVKEINAKDNFVEFENGVILHLNDVIGASRPEIFRAQIHQTIEQHMQIQEKFQRRGIGVKALSLFFIDRVANFTAKDGIIRRLFDEEFEKLKKKYPFYEKMKAVEVRNAYFAKSKPKKGEDDGEAIDTESRNQQEREAEKAAFALIMKDKERLLSFEEKTCFIFAHSALKEGWDNPNVFQICTLNNTVSEMKKRQEIGRGLRLAVNQNGERVLDDEVNILSVIANESYESYVSRLQTESKEDGQTPPANPTRAGKTTAVRKEDVFNSLAFKNFWGKLQRRAAYKINVDTEKLIRECAERINNASVPKATIVIEKGKFIVTDYTLSLVSCGEETCKLNIATRDTDGNSSSDNTRAFPLRADLARDLHDDRLRGYKIVKIVDDGDNTHVEFGNGQILFRGVPLRFQSEQGQKIIERGKLSPTETYPIFNLIDRAAKETGLTRPTVNRIFKSLSTRTQEGIFQNPEGFAGVFITLIKETLANHIVDHIEFFLLEKGNLNDWGRDIDDMFPPSKEHPQKELVPASKAGLYDQVQYDSDVEMNFIQQYLNEDDEVIFYFKFPPKFKLDFPRIIGDYNPDWGVARYDGTKEKVILELVRETKGGTDIDKLRFTHEARKIRVAEKFFQTIGVNYRVVDDKTADWWKSATEQGRII